MQTVRIRRLLISASLIFVIAGCSNTSPDYRAVAEELKQKQAMQACINKLGTNNYKKIEQKYSKETEYVELLCNDKQRDLAQKKSLELRKIIKSEPDYIAMDKCYDLWPVARAKVDKQTAYLESTHICDLQAQGKKIHNKE